MFITLGVGIAMWGDHVAVIVVLGGLAVFLVSGNLRARRCPRK